MIQLLLPFLLVLQSSFYDLQSSDLTGVEIDFNNFLGKKVLIVNTASNSQFASQFSSLESLYELDKDSLVIIAYPSNSFDNEPNDDPNDLNYIIKSTYNVSYILGEMIEVKGEQISSVYQWLTSQDLNGSASSYVENDFQKYLIDKNGKLVGVFAGSVDPMSNELRSAIESPN